MDRFNKILTVLVLLAGGVYYFTGTLRSTTDMIDGGHVLFMDDRISHHGVLNILRARDFREFRFQVADGDDHRYGRIMYNYAALSAFIPYKLHGEKGLILAVRLSLALAQFAGFVILVLVMVSAWYWRGLLLAILISLPNTAYYINVPKPEPLLILFLAIYLAYAVRNQFRFGPYWFFLGLAFGAKISVLPVIPLAAGMAILRLDSGRPRLEFPWKAGLKAFLFFMLGHMTAIPMLFQGHYAKWYRATFLATGHGQDSAGVNALTWLDFVLRKWTGVPGPLFTIVMVLFAAAVAFGVFRFLAPLLRGRNTRFPLELVLIGLGLALTVPIALTVKRVWGFYLHVGVVLIFAGLVLLLERRFRFESGDDSEPGPAAKLSFASSLMGAAALVIILPYMFGQSLERFDVWANRSRHPEHREKLTLYHDLVAYFRRTAGLKRWTLTVRYDPRLYPPEDSIAYKIDQYFGPFTQWRNAPDIVVTYNDSVLGRPLPAKDNAEYKPGLLARELHARHTAGPGVKCAAQPCFRRVASGHPTLRVYLKDDLFGKHPELRSLKPRSLK